VVILATISWYSAGPIITLNGRIIATDYVDILGNQVRPTVQMLFPKNTPVFQHECSPTHTARSVQFWFEQHGAALHHLPWTAQSPDLHIIELLWSVLESRVRSRLPPPSSVKQLEDVLHKERYSSPLETVQNLCESTAIRTQDALLANGGPTPY
jgi:hypothetical protein